MTPQHTQCASDWQLDIEVMQTLHELLHALVGGVRTAGKAILLLGKPPAIMAVANPPRTAADAWTPLLATSGSAAVTQGALPSAASSAVEQAPHMVGAVMLQHSLCMQHSTF